MVYHFVSINFVSPENLIATTKTATTNYSNNIHMKLYEIDKKMNLDLWDKENKKYYK